MTELETLEQRVRRLEDENGLLVEAVKTALLGNSNLLRLLHLKDHRELKRLTDREQQAIANVLEMLQSTVRPDCRATHALVPWIQ